MFLCPVLLLRGSTFQGRNGTTTQDPAVSTTPQHPKPPQLSLCSLEGSAWWVPRAGGARTHLLAVGPVALDGDSHQSLSWTIKILCGSHRELVKTCSCWGTGSGNGERKKANQVRTINPLQWFLFLMLSPSFFFFSLAIIVLVLWVFFFSFGLLTFLYHFLFPVSPFLSFFPSFFRACGVFFCANHGPHFIYLLPGVRVCCLCSVVV